MIVCSCLLAHKYFQMKATTHYKAIARMVQVAKGEKRKTRNRYGKWYRSEFLINFARPCWFCDKRFIYWRFGSPDRSLRVYLRWLCWAERCCAVCRCVRVRLKYVNCFKIYIKIYVYKYFRSSHIENDQMSLHFCWLTLNVLCTTKLKRGKGIFNR